MIFGWKHRNVESWPLNKKGAFCAILPMCSVQHHQLGNSAFKKKKHETVHTKLHL